MPPSVDIEAFGVWFKCLDLPALIKSKGDRPIKNWQRT
jgi:hypothetical protein